MSTEEERRRTSLWDLVDKALEQEGASKLHLAIGRPPMIRTSSGEIRPLEEGLPVLTMNEIQYMLALVVEPERWNALEQVGEGEMRLSGGSGRPITLTLFRNSGAWSAIVHF